MVIPTALLEQVVNHLPGHGTEIMVSLVAGRDMEWGDYLNFEDEDDAALITSTIISLCWDEMIRRGMTPEELVEMLTADLPEPV